MEHHPSAPALSATCQCWPITAKLSAFFKRICLMLISSQFLTPEKSTPNFLETKLGSLASSSSSLSYGMCCHEILSHLHCLWLSQVRFWEADSETEFIQEAVNWGGVERAVFSRLRPLVGKRRKKLWMERSRAAMLSQWRSPSRRTEPGMALQSLLQVGRWGQAFIHCIGQSLDVGCFGKGHDFEA